MPTDLRDTRIFIVDNAGEVRNLRETLGEIGCLSVKDQTNSIHALSEIKKERPDLVIANFNMPKYSGLQIFNSMKADKSLADVGFIMILPKMSRREIEDIEKQGVREYLARPFTADELKQKICGVCGFSMDDLKDKAEKKAAEAKKLYGEGDCEKAVNLYREASNLDKKAEHFFMQGMCYLKMELYDQAMAAFHNALELDKSYPEADHWLGVALQKKKDYQASIRALERAAKKEGATADTHVELGKSHLGADQVDQADEAFSQAMGMKPDDVDVRTKVGNAYLDKGIYDKAEKTFGEALDINPENIHLYNRMAIALRKQGKLGEAINLYVKALNVAPDDEGLYFNVARALYESGDKAKAVKALEKALRLDPDFAEAKTLLAEYKTA